ncbi:MAG: NADH-quinone oxidoreductase subunit C [Gemmatimonadetes bacterium]|nr:NADH-quinone oxidoreductase subunit C [Gemmatimonadota bacterium]
MVAEKSEKVDVAGRLRERFGEAVLAQAEFRGDLALTLPREVIHDALRVLRDEPGLEFNFLADVTVVDWLPLGRLPRFEVVYHLYSLGHHRRIRLKVPVEEDDRWVPTAIDLWPGANWFEREAWDMFGVVFEGHPNMRRLLCHEDFEGHPLRKDFPADKRFFLIRPSDLRDEAPDWVKERSGGRRSAGYIPD